MSYDEAQSWIAYARKRGTLNLGMRMEFLLGRLSYQVHHALKGKMELQEIVRFHQEDNAGIDDVAKLMGVSRVEKR